MKIKKRNVISKKMMIIVIFSLAVFFLIMFFKNKDQDNNRKISEFGKYQGYSDEKYNGYKRTSDYLTMTDGTKLAYDLILPTDKGKITDKKMPVLFHYTAYGRAWTVFDKDSNNNLSKLVDIPWYFNLLMKINSKRPGGNILDPMWRTKWLDRLVKSGYIVVVIERPGTGASFGKVSGSPKSLLSETDELLNWIANQPWCDGNIGMFGDSWHAQIQFIAASVGNPYLKAIFPATTWMDQYSAVMFPGGVLNKAFANLYKKANSVFDLLATPVDEDKDGSLLARAKQERKEGLVKIVDDITKVSFRDLPAQNGENFWQDYESLYPFLDQINKHKVPFYLINGWYDFFVRDNFLIYDNLEASKKLMVRPTDHNDTNALSSDIDFAAEAHRWFDHWLKNIDNGIMSESPIHYFLQGVDKKEAWRTANEWPLNDQKMTSYFFDEDILNTALSEKSEAFDNYKIDYTTTTGKTSQWTALTSPHSYPNLKSNDKKAITYTLPLQNKEIKIIGHPVVHIWLETNVSDLDAFVYLEEVDKFGNSTYVTQGNLRASHRLLNKAPFNNFGLPWHNHFQSELKMINKNEPVELVFDLLPTAYQFSKDKQIRITIAFADIDNFDTPIIEPAPNIKILRNSKHFSFVELPIIK